MPSAGLDSVLKRGRPARLDPWLVRTGKKTRGRKRRRGNYRHRPLEVVRRCLRELTRAVEPNLEREVGGKNRKRDYCGVCP